MSQDKQQQQQGDQNNNAVQLTQEELDKQLADAKAAGAKAQEEKMQGQIDDLTAKAKAAGAKPKVVEVNPEEVAKLEKKHGRKVTTPHAEFLARAAG